MNYTIYANGPKVDDVYGKGYFPRKYHYLRDARFTATRLAELTKDFKIVDKTGKTK